MDLKSKKQVDEHADAASLIEHLMKWYNGYSWDGKFQVLNHLSVLKFFERKRFGNYWCRTCSSLLTSRVANNTDAYFKIFDKNLSFDGSFPEMDLNNLNDTLLLMQAGYLTVASTTENGPDKFYNLKVPNTEIRDSIRLELLADFFVTSNTEPAKKLP
ncbi:MAG: hypothetical protein LBQ12_10435 [Deltaproteobacteria bacterium]|nr:hypothetical protein [Deltaproteobacteria bacterium]